MPALYVGRSLITLTASSGSRTAIGLPAATQYGDALLLSIISGNNRAGTCDDPRMQVLIEGALGGAARGSGVWVGYADGLTPLSIYFQGGTTGTGQFAMAGVYVWRNRKWDTARSVRTPFLGGATTGALPAVPGTGTGVLAIAQASGGIGGVQTSWPPAGPYARVVQDDGSYVRTDVGQSLLREVPASPDPAVLRSDASDIFRAVTVGFNDDELFPVRLYPRDDEGGLGSARRLYPPPKRVRRVGGIQ
ncbi:hypothetical protein Pam4_37 [Pseudanabaena phage Pam4]|nr:hypothetical protein Pam4_37 [Pseudanabaena phage Pam4]